MKKLNLLYIIGVIVLNLFSCENVFSQKISRGPDIGEIYFLGPTNTGEGLYYSTNSGETSICVDNTLNAISIAADKTKGSVYCQKMPVNLYYSSDYGYQNTWSFKHGDIYDDLNSGVSEGTVFNHIASHSIDYGNNFINHSVNGFFGSLKASEIDNQIGTGYAVTKSSSIPDSVFLLISHDNFDNLSIINTIHEDKNIFKYLTRGNNEGELFTIRNRPFSYDPYEIYHCDDFGNVFVMKNELNISNYYSFGVEGGRQNGELYLLYNFVNMMWQNAHTYIFHSTDYGVTFEVFHPFAKGQEPVLANFSSTTKEGNQPLTAEFCNFSIGNIQHYEWDFNNDGVVDSNEESPSWTYTEPGNYSVSLTITAGTPDSSNTFVKDDYITVLSGNSQEIELNSGYQFISSNRSPENPDMLELLGNNLNDNLAFVRNSQGQMLQNIGGNWVNNIGDWISTEGYLFKMNNEDVLIIDGETVNPQTPINLNTGYQFVSYLPNETLNALEAFSSILIDDLDFIRNSAGDMLRKIGPNWVNGIGDCEAGEGFLVKMNGEGILVYP
ncbi:MAG: PKD domain-containing protein [Bacteroidales bacterium]|nr:PKD domain-containing protein [Bacteroidales bacterium]